MFVIWYVSDKSMIIHMNNCTYRDCGDVFYTNFIKKDEKTLTLIYVCILKVEYIHNIMHVLLNMVQLLLFLWLFMYDIKNSDSINVSSTGETLIESEFLIVYVTMILVPEICLYAHKKYHWQFSLALKRGILKQIHLAYFTCSSEFQFGSFSTKTHSTLGKILNKM